MKNRRALSLVLLLVAWQALALSVQSPTLPGPATVARVLASDAIHGDLLFNLGITLFRVLGGFVAAMAIGTFLGTAMGVWPALNRWLEGPIVVLLNLPAMVLAVLLYIWLGLTDFALIAIVAIMKIPNVAVTVREGAQALRREYTCVAQVYRLPVWRRVRYVVMPQLEPYILAAARNGFALAWKIVLVLELLGRSSGVGFEIQSYFQLFDVAHVMAYASAFIVCAMLVDDGLSRLQRHALRWQA